MAMEKETQAAFRDTAQRGKAAGEEALRVGESATRRAADAARSITEEGVETARDAAGAGNDMAKRGLDTLRETIGAATKAAGDGGSQFQRLFGMSADAQGEAAQQARSNMESMMQCGTVLLDGWQSIMREWVGLAQEATARNVDGINALARSRSVPDLYAAQSKLMRDGVELLLSRSVKLSELSAQTADNAVRRLTERTEAAAGQPGNYRG